jgi:hypothetical protein
LAKPRKRNVLRMPEWLMREWESMAFQRIAHRFVAQSANPEFSLIPTPTETELDGFINVLSRIQHSILASRSDEFELVVFPPALVRKNTEIIHDANNAMQDNQKALSFRVIQLAFGKSVPVIRWFEDERWQMEESWGGVLRGRVVPEWIQLVLGLESSWQSFRRVLTSSTEIAVLPSNGPLTLWKDVWNELPVSLRGLYQLMERAIQWKSNWISLEGVFSESVSEFLQVVNGSTFSAAQKLALLHNEIEKLSTRLTDHGWLHHRQLQADDLGLMSSRASQGEILWRVSEDRMSEIDNTQYFEDVAAWFAEMISGREVGAFVTELAPAMQAGEVLGFSKSIRELIGDEESGMNGLAFKRGGLLTTFADVVIELVIRSSANCVEPLTADVRSSVERVTGMMIPRMNASTAELRKFCQNLRLRFDNVADLLQERNNLLQISYSTAAAWQSHKARRQPSVVSQPKETIPLAKMVADTVREQALLTASAPVAPVAPTIADNRLQQSGQVKVDHSLRRVAAEEIARMRKSDNARYDSLKTAFYNSLESSKQKVFSDLNKRLSPDEYERYLQFSLVKFMVDNPASWKSARTTSSNPLSSDLFNPSTLLS